MKGGGTKEHACLKSGKTNLPMIPSPEPKESYSPGSTEDNQYISILEYLETIPSDDMLILKIGSNDDESVKNEKAAGTGGVGTLGRNGILFLEHRNTLVNTTETSPILIKDIKPPQLRYYFKGLNDIKDNSRLHLLAVSPMPQYHEYSYPFIYNKEPDGSEGLDKLLFAKHYIEDKKKTYVQAFFPIGPNFNKDTNNYKILQNLINRKGPLFIFNAMGSACYQSLKYIMDMRSPDKTTYYGGLVDSLANNDALCEIGIRIYPDIAKECPKNGGLSRKTKTRKYRKRKSKISRKAR